MTESNDCTTTTTAQPNAILLAAIQDCQQAAVTPYCWPLNGTRICVPGAISPKNPAPPHPPLLKRSAVFWPPTFYPSDAEVALSTSPSSIPLLSNSGSRTQSFPLSLYNTDAYRIPGPENERMLRIYFRTNYTQPPEPNSDTLELMSYDGPTLILVKTADSSSSSSSSSTRGTMVTRIATASASAYSRDTTSGRVTELGQNRPEIAGAVMGVLAGFLSLGLLIFFCQRRKNRSNRVAVQAMAQVAESRSNMSSGRGVMEGPRQAPPSSSREPGGQEEVLPPYQTVVGREQPPAYVP